MAKMPNARRDWGKEAFSESFKREMECFRKDVLPLAEAIDEGNTVFDNDLGVVINEIGDDEQQIKVRVGVFFAQIVFCVSCGEGPPIDEAYCEMWVSIDKSTAETQFTLIKD
ncbi:hypothetical protein BOW53_14620 [Solemya pervernicosa gill symbiont]|uniref:Uncharacterized protein n=2 Tax=Gammaproteobacteria incertae sedis TaxID=118884 RepID=A0A1T2L0N8_9GAMM|nr:hypothetical protein [Candidatus Reidiella endopervernicosa]OOZ38677.1 hypothetical protein BOW53_14620 [Solemya pervernicosa gill symbiont]QKQ25188.1 glucosamine--fructose-6-phosphate aminotransferase [Candidatus Reidiella endopervernicosa]